MSAQIPKRVGIVQVDGVYVQERGEPAGFSHSETGGQADDEVCARFLGRGKESVERKFGREEG